MTTGVHAVNAYRIPVLYGRHSLVLTNTTPTTAYRGAGRPNVSYIIERLVEEAARETGIDRIELRRRNLIPKEAFPYQTPHRCRSTTAATRPDCSISRSSNPNGRASRSGAQNPDAVESCAASAARCSSSRRRGGSAPKEEVVLKFGRFGQRSIYTARRPSGQGHETVFPDIVAEVLGMDPEKITCGRAIPTARRSSATGRSPRAP